MYVQKVRMRALILLLRKSGSSAVASRSSNSRLLRHVGGTRSRLALANSIKSFRKYPQFSCIRSFSQLLDTKWRVLQDETDLLLSSPKHDSAILRDIEPLLVRWQFHPNAHIAAESCQELLNHWMEASQGKITTSEPFYLTLQAWNRVKNGVAYEAACVLDEWVKLSQGDFSLEPQREAYHLVLECFAQQGIVDESLVLLDYLERMRSMGSLTLHPPNAETYAHVITCLTKSTSPNVEEEWKEIQLLLTKLNKVENRQSPQHSYFRLYAYSHVVCHAAVSLGKLQDAVMMLQEELMNRGNFTVANLYWDEYLRQKDLPSPNHLVGRAYQAVFAKLVKAKGQERQMDMLLSRLEKTFYPDQGLPWPRHYAMTIQAWSDTCTNNKSDDEILETASHCEELLHRMEERHVKSADMKLDLAIYERVLRMYARVREPAERLLAHLMSLVNEYDTVTISEPMLTTAWNHVLKSWYLSGKHDEVLRLWQRMQDTNVILDGTTVTLVLKALSRMRHADAAMQAQHVLRNMPDHVERTSAHYEAVVVAFSRSADRDATKYAQALLEELEQLYDTAASKRRDELRPTTSIYNAIIAAHARRKNEAAANQVLDHMIERATLDKDCPLPDQTSFATILDGLSRQRRKTAAQKAEDLLAAMESTVNTRPNRNIYTAVMTAIVRSGDPQTPERVMRIYKRMVAAANESDHDSLRPDVVTYGVLLDMWSKSRRSDAGDKAEAILSEMKKNNDMDINLLLYGNAILAHARSKRARSFERAEALLREMQELGTEGNETVRPDAVIFTNVIMCLKRSHVENKAAAAWGLFLEMMQAWKEGDECVRPNVITINTVLTSCAFTKGNDEIRQRAVQIALTAFTEMDQLEIAPNSKSFCMLFETLGRQVSDMTERTRMAEVALHRCRREGLVDSNVIESLRKFVPPLYEQISRSLETAQAEGGDERSLIDKRKQ